MPVGRTGPKIAYFTAKKCRRLGDGLIYILFGIFIAGFSLFAFFVVEEARWSREAKGGGGRGLANDFFTWGKNEKPAPPLAGTALGVAGYQEEVDSRLEERFAAAKTEAHEIEETFEWGECTLRELEESLTRGVPLQPLGHR